MSRQLMRNIVEQTSVRFDPQQIKEEWDAIKHHMSKMGMMNACLPKEGVDRLKYFYIENPRVVPEIEGTIFEKFIKAVPIKINRGTFLNLIPNQCLRWHRDPDNKIHLHINDEPGCFFFDFEEMEAFPSKADGYAYRYHTSARFHSAINASSVNRAHLVLAEYHCRDSEPNKVWGQEVFLRVPKSITYPPKISPCDSVEQAFLVKIIANAIHNEYVFSGSASDQDDGEATTRRYLLEVIDPDKLTDLFNGEFDMVQQSLKHLGIGLELGEVHEKLC
jgi:hypothetical protein